MRVNEVEVAQPTLYDRLGIGENWRVQNIRTRDGGQIDEAVVNASGDRIEHLGRMAMRFDLENGQGRTMEAEYEVANVATFVMAVARVGEAARGPEAAIRKGGEGP